jgi:hypothetical protein
MRNVLLQVKERVGGHLILLVGETYLMKISNLLQHKLHSSHKDKLPLNFHLAFGTEHIHLITLTFVSPDFTRIFPRHRHSTKWPCHSMHIFILLRKTSLSRKVSSNLMLWRMSLQKSRCLLLSSFNIALQHLEYMQDTSQLSSMYLKLLACTTHGIVWTFFFFNFPHSCG